MVFVDEDSLLEPSTTVDAAACKVDPVENSEGDGINPAVGRCEPHRFRSRFVDVCLCMVSSGGVVVEWYCSNASLFDTIAHSPVEGNKVKSASAAPINDVRVLRESSSEPPREWCSWDVCCRSDWWFNMNGALEADEEEDGDSRKGTFVKEKAQVVECGESITAVSISIQAGSATSRGKMALYIRIHFGCLIEGLF